MGIDIKTLNKIAAKLAKPAFFYFNCDNGMKMPSLPALTELMQRLRAVFYPGFHTQQYNSSSSLLYHLSANLDSIYQILTSQIESGFCASSAELHNCNKKELDAKALALRFIESLPEIRSLLEGDVRAAYEGDPAASTPGETIFCYPSIQVMTNHRVAHALYTLGVPLIPRIINEMAHTATGIDIHPGAEIGKNFFIDHGTGVVIGETSVIGNDCRLYQGVTLGALSFPKEEDGSLSKGLKRHPILEDNVVVYSGATILGRVTIGRGSLIGGNVWITNDIPPGSKIVQQHSIAPEPSESLMGKR
ncbi:MAG: serine acetyltransferase [Deltaproteobacteria bacterium]|jgi:serine O-acetyltransferase|nr:serine acetyltransferase [Deltaproteobacteria bacterium]